MEDANMERKKCLIMFNFKKGWNSKKFIVIHDTGNKNDSDEMNAKYFSADGRNASAHYFIDDDSCSQLVLDNDIAWHVGDGKGKYGITNSNSIGIEMCRKNNDVTQKTIDNTIVLVKELMAKYKVPKENVVRHYDASRKNCPAGLNNDGKWISFKSRL
jgi:N-acetylmuramoyl-L-alanine amidase CwlA